jgi:hypothetical protein
MAPRHTRVVGLALALAATATVWFLGTEKVTLESAPQPAEIVRADRIASPAAELPISGPRKPGQSIPAAQSAEERAASISHMVTFALAAQRDRMIEALVTLGLSQTDAEQMGRRAIEGAADCFYEGAREQYESQGNLSEFLDHGDITWLEAALNLKRVRTAMAPCLANIQQQTGLPFDDSDAVGNLDERVALPPPPPPWAAEMDSRIRDYVASHSGLGVTDVVIHCREAGCIASLIGSDIRIFDFDFDVFAEQNGFQRAVVGGESNRRNVWLER